MPEEYLACFPNSSFRTTRRRPGWRTATGAIVGRRPPTASAGRSATGSRSGPDLAEERRLAPGNSTSAASTTAPTRGRHHPVLLPLRLLRRGPRRRQGQRRLVHRPGRRSGRRGERRQRIDALFENSPAETKTETEKALRAGVRQTDRRHRRDRHGGSSAVFFTMLLVAGNTMAQAVRERTGELGVLKALGFSNGQVMGLVLAESLDRAPRRRPRPRGLAASLARRPDRRCAADLLLPAARALMGVGADCWVSWPALCRRCRRMRLRIVDALRRA